MSYYCQLCEILKNLLFTLHVEILTMKIKLTFKLKDKIK